MNIHKFCGITLNSKKTTNLFVRFLLLILAISLSPVACSDSKPNVKPEEIGVPYLVESGGAENQVDGMSLAPIGERLYVLKNSILFQYELNPLRKINAITLKLDYDRDFIRDKNSRMFISNDEKRLVLYHPKKILLIDLDSKNIVKTLDYESQLGILNDEEFFTTKSDYTATIWRVNDFEKVKEFNLDFRGRDMFEGVITLHKIDDKIILFQGFHNGVFAVLDSKTYKASLVVHHVNDTSAVEISGNLQRLRINWKWDVEDRLNSTRKTVKSDNMTFDLRTWSMTEGWQRDKNVGWYYLQNLLLQVSPTRKYFLTFLPKTGMYYLLSPQGYARTIRALHHFGDGEMIVFNPPYTSKKYFQATANARKHMKMKDADGNTVSINDMTFDNYRKLSNAD